MINVLRPESEVFDQRSLSSFEGVPVTLLHPDVGIDPSNWQRLSVGHAQNIRREGDYVLADLVIGDARAIRAIREHGWRGISAGYDCGYAPDGTGGLRQHSIRANHIAVMGPGEDARCGPACSIGDSAWRPRREIAWGVPVRDQRGVETEEEAVARMLGGEAILPSPGNLTMGGEGWPITGTMSRVSGGTGMNEAEAAMWRRGAAVERERQRRVLAAVNRANRQQWGLDR
jgi:hypothetical protein